MLGKRRKNQSDCSEHELENGPDFTAVKKGTNDAMNEETILPSHENQYCHHLRTQYCHHQQTSTAAAFEPILPLPRNEYCHK